MKKLLMVVLCVCLGPGLVLAAADTDGFRGPNQLKSSTDVTLYRENDRAVPVYVSGTLARNSGAAWVETALDYFEQHKAAYRMDNPAEQLTVKKLEVDDLGMRHIRFDQLHDGIRVIGGELIAHYTAGGVLKTVNGTFEPEIQLDVLPSLSPAEAISIADTDLQGFFGKGEPNTPELVVFPWEGEHYLAWRLFLFSDGPMGRWEYFVDANSGEVIFNANRIMDDTEVESIGTGTGVMGDPRNHIDTDFDGSIYRMIDYTRRANNDIHGHSGQMAIGADIRTNVAGASLPGTLATDADNVWDDPNTQSPAVDGQVYSALVYDYLLNQFGRNGFDDQGSSMLTIVNYSGDGDNNAYWDGTRIVVWSWSVGWRSLAGCPDVIAHEWGHAVTEYTSNLVYQKEPGALNESFSDMIGAAFEWAHDTLDVPDWQMGENGRTTGVGFRDMEFPHDAGDPDFYGPTDPYWIDVINCSPSYLNDYCGVHTNSGVGNKWFQLLSDGGTHYGNDVTGIGVQEAMGIAYRANALYWNSQTDYHEAALGTISAAEDLDSTGAWAQSVAQAWTAVGVTVPGPGLAIVSTNIPNSLAPGVDASFDVTISGTLDGQLVPGTPTLHYAINGGAYQTTTLTPSGPNWVATIPAASCDEVVTFFVSAEEATNGLFYDPADTASPYLAPVATSVVTIFDDNFETDLGWTVAGSVTDGAWERGVPAGGGFRGDPPTDFDGSGQCYLTDNVEGNSDVDGGTTQLLSPTFDLSAGDARISYARWYNNAVGDDPFNDIFYIYISNNNGSTWTLVEQVGPLFEANGGWIEHAFWAADVITPTATMRLRFDVGDLNAGSVVEAGLDAFNVTRYECNVATPTIQTTALPDWTEGMAFSEQLTAVGGTAPYTWSDLNGDLAGTGLTLSGSGLLSGNPVTAGTTNFTARVTDDNSQTDDQLLSIVVNVTPYIEVPPVEPEWTEGQPYSSQLIYSGGTGVGVWSDKNNDLVGTGLTLGSDGLLQGTPNTAGPVGFTAYVIDAIGAEAESPMAMTINQAVQVTTDSLADGKVDDPYSAQLQAQFGTGTLSWSDKDNSLIGSGLTLDASGQLSGTPTDTGLITFTARAADMTGSTDEQVLTIRVDPAYICGDINNDGSGPNLTDLTYMVSALFQGGPAIPIPDAANVSGDDTVNLTDLTLLVSHLFVNNDPITCAPVQ